jgi:hypothetical protein
MSILPVLKNDQIVPPPQTRSIKRPYRALFQDDASASVEGTAPKAVKVFSSRQLFNAASPSNRSAMPNLPILSPVRQIKTPLERHLDHPFIQRILQVEKQTADDGFIPLPGAKGTCMSVWINPEKTLVRKHPIVPHYAENGRDLVNGQVLERNLGREAMRYGYAQKVFHNRPETSFKVAETVFRDVSYDQTYTPSPLPQQGQSIPDFILQDVINLASAFYKRRLNIDINPANFGCRTANGDLSFFDFGLGLSNEAVENEEVGSEAYGDHILASFSGYFNDWEKLYPGSRAALCDAFIKLHPEAALIFYPPQNEE